MYCKSAISTGWASLFFSLHLEQHTVQHFWLKISQITLTIQICKKFLITIPYMPFNFYDCTVTLCRFSWSNLVSLEAKLEKWLTLSHLFCVSLSRLLWSSHPLGSIEDQKLMGSLGLSTCVFASMYVGLPPCPWFLGHANEHTCVVVPGNPRPKS